MWTLLETESGKTNICRSESFHFDNKGPTVTLTSTSVSEISFTLTVTADDDYSELKECQFYINGELEDTKDIREGEASYTAVGVETGDTECYVIITDSLENETKKIVTAKTKLYTWWECSRVPKYAIFWPDEELRSNTTQRNDEMVEYYSSRPTINPDSSDIIYCSWSKPTGTKRWENLKPGNWFVASNGCPARIISSGEASTMFPQSTYFEIVWYDVKVKRDRIYKRRNGKESVFSSTRCLPR